MSKEALTITLGEKTMGKLEKVKNQTGLSACAIVRLCVWSALDVVTERIVTLKKEHEHEQ